MPKLRYLSLNDDQRRELLFCRDHNPLPHMREKAAALLKVGDGQRPAQVARSGLLKPHDPDVVRAWITRYEREGLSGLRVRQGRGRKPAFSPHVANEAQAQAELNELVACDPALHGVESSRWTLKSFLSVLQQKGYRVMTTPSVHRFLRRMGIRWIKARYAQRSPDPLYQAKLDYIEEIKKRVKQSQGREILLYLDECNYYRQPTLANTYTRSDQAQEKVKRSFRSDTLSRVLGTLDASNGRVLFFQAPKISVSDHTSFYKRVREAYPDAERIWIVQDNNPVHFHPNLRVALEEQVSPFTFTLPPNWSEKPKEWAIKRFEHWKLPIQLVQIPTYAPWCNPIEKLWRKFKQDLIHNHRSIDDLETLRAKARQFFEQFAQGSAELLQYVGLGVPS